MKILSGILLLSLFLTNTSYALGEKTVAGIMGMMGV